MNKTWVKKQILKGECCCGDTLLNIRKIINHPFLFTCVNLCCYGNIQKKNGKLHTTDNRTKIQFET